MFCLEYDKFSYSNCAEFLHDGAIMFTIRQSINKRKFNENQVERENGVTVLWVLKPRGPKFETRICNSFSNRTK